MSEIILITDYKGHFGSKSDSLHYRSGMNLKLLEEEFTQRGFSLKIISFSDIDFRQPFWEGKHILYTSQEDVGYIYKSYIEDIVYNLELTGAIVIPQYKYLRANNNKVVMEILRDFTFPETINHIKSYHFGTVEELYQWLLKHNITYPVVIKSTEGARSDGVFIGTDEIDLITKAKKVSVVGSNFERMKDVLRSIRHNGYKKESFFRKKFIIQNFIAGLSNDWKILVFGNRFYIEYRGVRENDFRASGSGKFKFGEEIPIPIPEGIFEYVELIRDTLDTPVLSLDVGYDGHKFYLFEYQAIFFSSYAQRMAGGYYAKSGGIFQYVREKNSLENVYVNGITDYIENKLS